MTEMSVLWRFQIIVAWFRNRDGDECYLCGEAMDFIPPLNFENPGRLAVIEHLKPLRRGGLDRSDNIRLAHLQCNSSKGNKTPREYLVRLGLGTDDVERILTIKGIPPDGVAKDEVYEPTHGRFKLT